MEHVKELATAAADWCEENAVGTPIAWEWEEKFAELIIKECCRIAKDTHFEFVKDGEEYYKHAQGAVRTKMNIEEYFGVKL